MDSKPSLRRTAQHSRLGRPAPDLEAVLSDLLEGAARVASYVPLASEPGTPPRAGWLLPILLPDGDLDWSAYDGTLVAGLRGTQQPPGPLLGVDAVARCDVVLVPALLVDRHGVRLGKGGGSYDRALARCTGLTVALVHDDELVDALPAEPHDVPVRAVATPARGLVHLTGMM